MSNLEELIERLCPDGVKAVELGQVAHYCKLAGHQPGAG